MAIVDENAAMELPLNDERLAPRKQNRHVTFALGHMNKRRMALQLNIDKLTKERDDLDAAIKALE